MVEAAQLRSVQPVRQLDPIHPPTCSAREAVLPESPPRFASSCCARPSQRTAPERQHQVKRAAALELVVLCRLVVYPVPVGETCQPPLLFFFLIQLNAPRGCGGWVSRQSRARGNLKLHLFSAVNQPLLRGRNALLLLNLLLDLSDLFPRGQTLLFPSRFLPRAAVRWAVAYCQR